MISIKPDIEYEGCCPWCNVGLVAERILWQGIHVCAVCRCNSCGAKIVGDLGTGQAYYTPFRVDLGKGLLFGAERARIWFGEPLLKSLEQPDFDQEVGLTIEKIVTTKDALILNCIDYLYGHSLLKLLNAEEYLTQSPELALVVIVPGCLRWMVPDGVAEIWTVDIPLSRAQHYFPKLDELIGKECERFERIWLSSALSHPSAFDITNFTRVARHDFNGESRITFIWREDRLWVKSNLVQEIARRTGLTGFLLTWQNLKVIRLFSLLRRDFPTSRFTVAGLGKSTSFPSWIEDVRVERFNDKEEQNVCRVYAKSRLVIGVHGSSMLLPSAHAGLTLDIMPRDRWSNITQDVLYHEVDSRMATFRYRFVPIGASLADVALIAGSQAASYESFRLHMVAGQRENI